MNSVLSDMSSSITLSRTAKGAARPIASVPRSSMAIIRQRREFRNAVGTGADLRLDRRCGPENSERRSHRDGGVT